MPLTRPRWQGFVLLAVFLLAAIGLPAAPGEDARYLDPLPWNKVHVNKVLGLGYTELGSDIGGSRSHVDVRQLEGMTCLVGPTISFDVDDAYAFDIDEDVDLTLTYAPAQTAASALSVLFDRSGGDGRGSVEAATLRGASGLQTATVRLKRARFAGGGAQSTDFAVNGRGGAIALCDIQIARTNTTSAPAPAGVLQVTVQEAGTGRVVPARIGLYDENGRMPLPSDDALRVLRFTDVTRRQWLNRRTFWPSDNREAFYVNGKYEGRVPAGTYQLVATHGPEYRAFSQTIDVKPGETAAVTVSLMRYDDLTQRGWYSGESHLHLKRERAADPNVWAQVAAEDLHLANLLEMGNITGTYFKQPAWGRAGRYERDGVALVAGQEDPRTVMRGHTIHWNIAQPTHSQETFFQYHYAFERSRAQGGMTGYAHLGELFNGRRGLAVDVPFGLVDFIEVLQGGRINTDIWYSFLNLGYHVLPVGGADFPYFGPTLPGVERTYVKIDGPFTIDGWFAGAKSGHMYVTNGPFLEFSVNGHQMGEEIHVPRGARLDLSAVAGLNPDVDRLDRLELVRSGDVALVDRATSDRIEMRQTLTADRSMWLAVRAYGGHQEPQFTTIAHSAPIYVVVDDEPTWKREAVESLVALQLAQLKDLSTLPIEPDGDLEAFETKETLLREWPVQGPKLQPRVEEAAQRYQALLDRLRKLSTQ
jgi:hypothetical protein